MTSLRVPHTPSGYVRPLPACHFGFIINEVEELIDLFQRPLYDIQRAWRAPLFRIVQQLSQGILLQGYPEDEERCTLAFLILPGRPGR